MDKRGSICMSAERGVAMQCIAKEGAVAYMLDIHLVVSFILERKGL